MTALPVSFTVVDGTRANAVCVQSEDLGKPVTIYKLTIATHPNWEVTITSTDAALASKFFYELSHQAEYLAGAAALRAGIQAIQDNA